MNFILVNKPVGKTPLEMAPQTHEKIGYAGRLDPMAEGLMIYLVGDENKKRKKYEKLTKTYELDCVWGFKTDSYDLMGIPKINKAVCKNTRFLGKFLQEYPPYSYPKVRGKPLYWWARRSLIDKIEIPKKEVEIYSFVHLKDYSLQSNKLLNYIKNTVSGVNGDFRQEKIINAWRKLLDKDFEIDLSKFEIECSSGTYVRGIANEMGATAFKIKRTRIGDFALRDVLSLNNEVSTKKNNHR